MSKTVFSRRHFAQSTLFALASAGLSSVAKSGSGRQSCVDYPTPYHETTCRFTTQYLANTNVRAVWARLLGVEPQPKMLLGNRLRDQPKYVLLEHQEEEFFTSDLICFDGPDGDLRADPTRAWLLRPKGRVSRRPAILCLHQTDSQGNGLNEPPAKCISGAPQCASSLAYALHLVKRGFVTLTPSYYANQDDCDSTASMNGKSFGYDPRGGQMMKSLRVFMRSIDLLQSLRSVDGQRIGCIGHSAGGFHCVLLSLFERRLKAVVSSCGFSPLPNYFSNNGGGFDTYMPMVEPCVKLFGDKGVPFDFGPVLSALAPMPVFISISMVAKEHPEETKAAVERARESFGKFKPRFVIRCVKTHDMPEDIRDAAYNFLANWV